MGEKIDIGKHLENANWSLSFWNRRDRNSNLGNKNLQKKYYEVVDAFCSEFKIYNQAFLIANKAMDSYNILQGNNFGVNALFDENQVPFIKYPLPEYQETQITKQQQIQRALIDLMFEMKRENQSISQSSADLSKDSFLKVSLGEVVQYITCWRWLMRYAQIFGFDYIIKEELDICDIILKSSSSEIKTFWDIENFKNSINIYEYIWIDTIDQLEPNKKYFGYPDIHYDDIKEYWKNEITGKLDNVKYIDINEEFNTLKINSEKNKEALFKFLKYYNKKNNEGYKDKVIYYGIKKLLGEIRKKIVDDKSEDFSVLNYLSVLHDISNFPILPYFYQTVLEGNDYFFEHFVIPVGFTDSFSYKTENKQNEENHTAIYALFSIEPTLLEDRNKIMNSLQTFFRFISIPISDACFYGTIYKTNIEIESLDSFIDTINHETTKVINTLKNKMFLNSENYEIQIKEKSDTTKITQEHGSSCISKERFRILVHPERYDFLLAYINKWFNNFSSLTSNDIPDNKFIKSIVEDSIRLYLYAYNSDLRGYSTNDLINLERFDNAFKASYNSINNKVNLSIDAEISNLRTNNDYVKLLFAALNNTFKHSDEANHISINITRNGDKFVYEIVSELKVMNDKKISEIKEKIAQKRDMGTRKQLQKFTGKLKGELKLFDLDNSNSCFITCFEVPVNNIND